MNHPGEQQALSPVTHNVPVLNTPLAAHTQDFERDADFLGRLEATYGAEAASDVAPHLRTLHP